MIWSIEIIAGCIRRVGAHNASRSTPAGQRCSHTTSAGHARTPSAGLFRRFGLNSLRWIHLNYSPVTRHAIVL